MPSGRKVKTPEKEGDKIHVLLLDHNMLKTLEGTPQNLPSLIMTANDYVLIGALVIRQRTQNA